MTVTLPKPVLVARKAIADVIWDFADAVDLETLQLEAEKHLTDYRDYCGRELSEQEEEDGHHAFQCFHVLRKHLYEMQQLMEACHQFFVALTDAGAQELLAQRANLKEIPAARWPSQLVHYPQAPLPSCVTYGECEYCVGGPHVLGARLLWWCAAAKDPKAFDYSLDFRLRLWMLPIWTKLEEGKGLANPKPIEAIIDAVDAVCANFTSIAADARAEPPANSPATAGGDTHTERMDNVFRLRAKTWDIWYQGKQSSPGRLVGLKHICVLLSHSGQSFSALDLIKLAATPHADLRRMDAVSAAQSGLVMANPSRGEDILGREALQSLYERIKEIDKEIEIARQNNDPGQQESLETEKEGIRENIHKSITPLGKNRKLGDEPEKARKSVLNAINRAIENIRQDHPALADYLLRNIETGIYCTYNPSISAVWQV